MGHTNSTVNYNLPQFLGTDKPSWLGDVNGAFLAIDGAIAAAKSQADTAAGGVASLQNTVGGHTTQIGALTDTVTAQGGTLNAVTALIGNGTPTTTDQTIIGAINELDARTKYEVLETAAANQTYAAQMAILKAKFDTLEISDILRTAIIDGNSVYLLTVTNGRYGVTTISPSNQHVAIISLNLPTTSILISEDGTVSDISSSTNATAMYLVRF